jgi:hypothetical protein
MLQSLVVQLLQTTAQEVLLSTGSSAGMQRIAAHCRRLMVHVRSIWWGHMQCADGMKQHSKALEWHA